ncbi:MAG: glycerophosphodiester phosphodiesterase [Candidatus Cryptobacteroides sp.]
MKKLFAFMALAAVTVAAMPHLSARSNNSKKVAIVAHRGFWNCEEAGKAKNSLASLAQAQANGFWGSEFDVNMTSDGVLVVYHDDTINGKRIEEHTFADFSDVRLANGECLPTLESYLDQALKKKIMLVFELKPHSTKEIEDKAVEASIGLLKKKGLLKKNRVMFISFSMNICKEFASRLPGFTVQYLDSDYTATEVWQNGVNGIDSHYSKFTKDTTRYDDARSHGMSINAWTVNDEKVMETLIDMGVDQITTDKPLLLREVLAKTGSEK